MTPVQAEPQTETTPAAGSTAETTPTGAGPNDQFLGIEPDFLGNDDATASESSPEPTETETETDAEEQEPETEEQAEGEEQETEQTETEESDDEWLPSDQEKRFPVEVLEEYANRRGYNWNKIKDDPDQIRLLSDKLNSDIFIRQQREEGDQSLTLEEEQALSGEEPEATTTTTTATDPRAEHYKRVDALVSSLDSKATEELGRGVLGAFGVNTDPAYVQQLQTTLKNPDTPPEQRAEIQQHLDLVQNASKIGNTLGRGAIDLIVTSLPSILPGIIEQIYPGTQERFERGQMAEAWQGVRQSAGAANLPDYGTPEFRTLVLSTEKQLGIEEGGLGRMVFRNQAGNPLPAVQQAARKYALVARVASGQKPRVDPKTVADAVTTGRNQERDRQQRRVAGRALGAGQTSRQFTQPEVKDDVMDALTASIEEQNQDEYPVSNLTRKR